MIHPLSPTNDRRTTRCRSGTARRILGGATCALVTLAGAVTLAAVDGPEAGAAQPAAAVQVAAGTVASMSGQTLEVQNATSQTTVDYAATTTFTQTTTGALADVTVGECLTAAGTPATPKSGKSGKSGKSAPSAPTDVTATAVRITQPVAGACSAGAGSGFRGVRPPIGASGSIPRRPGGAAGRFAGRKGGFGRAGGIVTAVHGTTVTVDEVVPVPAAKPASKPAPKSKGKPVAVPPKTTLRSVTVTVTAGTTFTKTAPASPGDLALGGCVIARGPADSTGAISAAVIALSSPGPSGCTFGFRGGAGRGFGRGATGA